MNVLIIGKIFSKDLSDLKKSGCSVTVELDGVAGIEKLNTGNFDAVGINRQPSGFYDLSKIIRMVEMRTKRYTVFDY